MSHPREFTDQNFAHDVVASSVPVLVDFWAAWCGPCRAIAPLIDQLAADWAGRVTVGKLDVDRHQLTASRYQVRSIPTMLLFKDGRVVDRLVGAQPRARIEAMLLSHVDMAHKLAI